MKSFDHRAAWEDIAKPAKERLADATLALFAQVVAISSDLVQGPTLAIKVPATVRNHAPFIEHDVFRASLVAVAFVAAFPENPIAALGRQAPPGRKDFRDSVLCRVG